MGSIQEATELLVRGYLVHRSMHKTLSAFDEEAKHVADGRFEAVTFIENMNKAIDTMDVEKLETLWDRWNSHVFNSLDQESVKVARQHEAHAYRLFLVKCVAMQNIVKCNEFFKRKSSLTLNNPEWTDWYSFPYNPHAREMDHFKKYYDNTWVEIYMISLHNFLSICLSSLANSGLGSFVEIAAKETNQMSASSVEFDEELMDDFAVIAQSAPVKTSQSKRSLKSLLKSLGKRSD